MLEIALVTREEEAVMAMWRPESSSSICGEELAVSAAAPSRDRQERRADRGRRRGEQGIGFGFKK